jgi:hypothetical protein
VAVEGEFRRLVHYVDDLVDGRRASVTIGGGWSTSRVCDCCVYCHELCVVGCVPIRVVSWVDCSHAVPVVRCVHCRAG